MTGADLVRARLADGIRTQSAVRDSDELVAVVERAADVVITCLRQGGTVFFAGNGGSSTDAQHLAAELLGRFYLDRPALAAVNLSDNTAALTAIANDYAYEEVFARQLAGLARAGDVFLGFSTSGNSMNIVRAVEVAADRQVYSIAFTGSSGGKLADVADLVFRAPSDDVPRVQECHVHVGHSICEIAERALLPTADPAVG
jgi:D-sedoheptulose 7-phosphate isomerase